MRKTIGWRGVIAISGATLPERASPQRGAFGCAFRGAGRGPAPPLHLSCTHPKRSSSLARICAILPQTPPSPARSAGDASSSIGSGPARAPCTFVSGMNIQRDADGQRSDTPDTAVLSAGDVAAVFHVFSRLGVRLHRPPQRAPTRVGETWSSASHTNAGTGFLDEDFKHLLMLGSA